MKFQFTIYELGALLNNIMTQYEVNILTKIKLSGGWMTMTGTTKIDYIPTNKVLLKGNNIISLKVINNDNEGATIKITGEKDKNFSVDLSPARYKEVNLYGLNIDRIHTNVSECKLRIDENIILTIKASVDEVAKFIN